jgi:KipI family sensor histidine kinase inhibitor
MWRIVPAGDQALLVTLGSTVQPELLGAVISLERTLLDHQPKGLTRTVGAYGSLLCYYDPTLVSAARLGAEILALRDRVSTALPATSVLDVPTRYDGPDLTDVANATRLTPNEVIELHAGHEYLVYGVGFAPGFTYCGELPDQLALPRRPSPRQRVPAGSVAIAGRQAGIYAVESPGGWHLIGRTSMALFDPAADPPARFKPGDRLRFVPAR